MKNVVISGSFDDIRSSEIGFFKAAAATGRVNLVLWSDQMHKNVYGSYPKFKLAERLYFTESIRYITKVTAADNYFNPDSLPAEAPKADIWLINPCDYSPEKKEFCRRRGINLRTAEPSAPKKIEVSKESSCSSRKKIVVTGCYDYFHTGHIRFFEEVSGYGDLHVVIGSDKNVALLKGEGHPHYNEDERLLIVQAIKFVKSAHISTGRGWMDAEPEIDLLKPDIYAVNEDGDKPEKREFCEKHGLQYLILKRSPKKGLPARSSTDLRGF